MLISDAAEIRTAEFSAPDSASVGAMTYFVNLGDRELVMRLNYRIEGSVIVTTQEGAESEIRASFLFADRDTLVLDYGGEKFTFRRVLA
jgi:hypothetical protein